MVTRPLQGLTRYLVNLAELLHRASIGSPDLQRQKTRLVYIVLTFMHYHHLLHLRMSYHMALNCSLPPPLRPPFSPARSAIQRVAELLVKMRANSEALAVATEYKLNQLMDTLKS